MESGISETSNGSESGIRCTIAVSHQIADEGMSYQKLPLQFMSFYFYKFDQSIKFSIEIQASILNNGIFQIMYAHATVFVQCPFDKRTG